MIGEIDFDGVFVPTLLVLALLALPLAALARLVLSALGAYRLVWHKPLFDLAVFVLIIGGLQALLHSVPLP